jgi:hypothetical protein
MTQLSITTYDPALRTVEGMRHERPAKPRGEPRRQKQISTAPSKADRPDLHGPLPERVPFVFQVKT